MTRETEKARHEAVFGEPLRASKTRADWFLAHYLKRGGVQAAIMFDRAAEEHQLAASREAASRRYRGLPPE